MGTSTLRNAFPEAVVRGLKRWQAKARKNIAKKNNYAPSLDASLDASLTSLSFSTLDASLSVELGYTDDELFTSVEIAEEDSVSGKQVQKLGSFEGFDLGKTE